MPEAEWNHLLDIFSVDELAGLLNISPASLRRYASKTVGTRRPTPNVVAARLHFLTLVVDALSGGYNDFGVRRWFERTRTQLDGRSPDDLLRDNWAPEQDGPRRVWSLAEQLATAGAT